MTPAKIESWLEDSKLGVENALRAKLRTCEQYERQPNDLWEAYCEAMLEIRPQKMLASLLGKDES